MVAATFLAGTLMAALEGLGYVLVGFLLLKRVGVAAPLTMFRTWWFAVGANKLLAAASGALVAWTAWPVEAFVAGMHVSFLLLGVSLAALMGYILHVLRGRSYIGRIGAAYFVYAMLLTYNLVAGGPAGVEVGAWRARHVASAPGSPVLGLLLLAGLVLPQTVGAVALLAHVRRVGPGLAARLALVAGSILLWTLGVALLALPGQGDAATVQVLSRVAGLAAALVAVLAYYPPARWAIRLRSSRARPEGSP